MNQRKAMWIMISVMLLSLLGTAGIALPYPVLAPYFLDSPANDLTHFMGIHPKILLGLSLAIYPLGMLIGSIFVGALSDHFGRRKMLLITLTGTIVGYFLTTLAILNESFIGFSVARLLTGICEGNISIARALAAELHPTIDRTRALSLSYAASYAGWLIGPIIGAWLMPFGIEHVFNAAAIGIVFVLILVYFTIPSFRKEDAQEPLQLGTLLRENNSLNLLKHKDILPIFWFYFIYCLGLNAFYEFYPVWFVDTLDADSKRIASSTIALTVCMILVSSFLVDRVNRRFGEIHSIIFGSCVLALLLAIQPFSDAVSVYFVFMLIGATIAITNGMIPTYLSKYFGHLGQGKVMGLQTTVFCIANVIIAVIGGPISILSADLILWIGAALVLVATTVMIASRQQQYRLVEHAETQEANP